MWVLRMSGVYWEFGANILEIKVAEITASLILVLINGKESNVYKN